MFISIYNRANTLIYTGNCEVRQKFRVMGEETTTVTVVSEAPVAFNYGDYIDVVGDRFYLHTNPKKVDSGTHRVYTLSFESAKYKLFGIIFQSFGRSKFDITTDLEGWAKLIVENANRNDSGWSYVINEKVDGFKTLVVDEETCLAAANRIFSEFKKEFRFVGKQLVVGRVGTDLSHTLKVGRYQGAYQILEEQDGTASPITRLYVYGSDKNLPVKYNNADGATPTDRLTIKAVNLGLGYIEDAAKVALYGVIEGSYTNEDIYPHRTGTISTVDANDIQNFTDSNIDFDVNAQLLPGIAAKVTFVSGDLSGYTFDVVSYNATSKQVRIAVGNDGSGKELPNATFKPKVGDKYVFTDIAMPQSYITAAENELLAAARAEYAKVSGWQKNFKLTAIDPIYQQDLNFYPTGGDKFGITSGGIVQQVRIVEYSVNRTTEVPMYDGVQLADKVEPSLAQQNVNGATQTSSSVYMANKSATTAQVCAVNANSSATNAAAAAAIAQLAADVANGSIADMCSDDKVTSIEKQMFKREWDIIVSEKDKNVQQADTFGVSRTAYVTAYSDLLTFLGTNLNDLTTTWNLGTGGGVTLRSKFKGYYDARTDLLNAISLKAKQAADAAQNAANTVQQGALIKSSSTQQVVNSPVQFVGQVQFNGDIIQNGAAYETHAQHVFSANDFITLRDGAANNLADGAYTGFEAKRVFSDGADGFLVYGNDGMARVGKKTSLQMLATREDAPMDGGVAVWSSASRRFNAVSQAPDSVRLGGRLFSDYWHKDNLNRSDVDFTAKQIVAYAGIRSNDQNGAGFTASGWKIGDYSNLLNLDVRGRLMTYEFVQNKLSILNGNAIISDNAKCNYLSKETNQYGKHLIYRFEEICPLNVGDTIRCKSTGKDYSARVSWKSDNGFEIQCWAVNDNAFNNASTGDLLARWSSEDANRKGLLYLNSSDTNNPNFQVIHDGTVKGCFGNCAGLNWQGAALPANSYGTWIDNGWFSGAVNADRGNVGGWSINKSWLLSPNGKMCISAVDNAIQISRPSGGYVMLGQTYANGAWTGKYGFSATDANLKELVRIDDEVCRFAGGAMSITADDVIFSDKVKLQWTSGNLYIKGTGLNRSDSTVISVNGGLTNLVGNSRGHVLIVLNRSNLSIVEGPVYYDTYGESSARINLATKLNNLNDNVIVCLASYNACCIDKQLADAIAKCGGTGKEFEAIRMPYAFVGIPGIGANRGIEVYTSEASSASFAEISCKIINGMIQSVGSSANKLTHIDANGVYTGTLTAEQIKANLADVGGFHIEANRLYSNGEEGSVSIEAEKGLSYIGKGMYTGHNCRIGRPRDWASDKVYDKATAIITTEPTSPDIEKIALYVGAAGGVTNKAVFANGDIVSNSCVVGSGYNFIFYNGTTYDWPYELNLFKGTRFMLWSNDSGGYAIKIPGIAEIEVYFGLTVFPSGGHNRDFCFEIIIIGKHNMSKTCRVLPGEFGYFKNRDGNNWGSFDIGGGDSCRISLCRYGDEKWAQVMEYNT